MYFKKFYGTGIRTEHIISDNYIVKYKERKFYISKLTDKKNLGNWALGEYGVARRYSIPRTIGIFKDLDSLTEYILRIFNLKGRVGYSYIAGSTMKQYKFYLGPSERKDENVNGYCTVCGSEVKAKNMYGFNLNEVEDWKCNHCGGRMSIRRPEIGEY